MIQVNKNKCSACGLCVEICHESCMTLVDDEIHIDYDFCSTCTQCIAVCPNSALSWNNIPPEPYNSTRLPTSELLDEMLKQRRTIRFFKEKKPPRSLIEEIIGYSIYAPSHNFSFRAEAVDDKDQLDQIDNAVFLYNKKIYKYLYRPKIIHKLIKLLASKYEPEYLKAKPKLEKSLKINRAYKHIPPVIIFLISEKNIPLSVESAQYALYNINLYAQTKGLGSRILVGNQMFLNKNKQVRSLLQLKKNEKIFGTIGLGYPQTKFKNKVLGKEIKIQWTS